VPETDSDDVYQGLVGYSSEVAKAGHDDGGGLPLLLRWEHVPESESLVTRPRHERLTIGARRQVQDSVRVPSQRRNLLHGRVAPNVYLILAVSVRTDKFVDVFCKHEVADLTSCFNALKILELDGVPELDGPVLRATTCGQEALLVRRPGDGLDRSLMLVELDEGLGAAPCAPEQKLVIVAP